jgi:imidazolonepropionase-like amidohydrolase
MSMSFALLVAALWLSNCVNPQVTMASKVDCHQADAELRKSERIGQLPIPTTGNYDADFNATQMQLAQRELIAAHFEISCGTNPKAIQAAKGLEKQAQKRLELYHNLPQN